MMYSFSFSDRSLNNTLSKPNTNVDRSWNRGKYLSRERGIPRSQWSTTVGECVPVPIVWF